MYSSTFALTIIIVIALTNLFLGFASAVLIGRGPKRWSDVDRAIVLQPFALDLILPRRKPKVERIDVRPGKTPIVIPVEPEPPATAPAVPRVAATPIAATPSAATPIAATAPATSPANGPSSVLRAGNATARKDNQLTAPTPTVGGECAAKKFVLPSVSPTPLDDHDPPEMILNRQVDAWRDSDLRDETPSLSGLTVDIRDAELDASILSHLMSEIRTKIVRQLRKDRRVLTIAPHKFAWFSCDVSPDDALMPVERIRQMLVKTRFHDQGDTIHLTVTAGVVSGSAADNAADLIQRLQLAMTSAREQGESPTYLDAGEGPKPVTPFTLEIEETECDLAR